nr:unnamed protein product [Digitaria exilis]
MEPAFHQAATGRHGADVLPPLPIAAPQPERVPVPRDLVVPLHNPGDLAAEAVGRGRVHQDDLALALAAGGAGGPEELGLEPLEARRAEGLELELLQHVLRRVLQVPELAQPERDEFVAHHPSSAARSVARMRLSLALSLSSSASSTAAGSAEGPNGRSSGAARRLARNAKSSRKSRRSSTSLASLRGAMGVKSALELALVSLAFRLADVSGVSRLAQGHRLHRTRAKGGTTGTTAI